MKKPVLKFAVRNDMYPYPVLFWMGQFDSTAMQKWVVSQRVGKGVGEFSTLWDDGAACYDLTDGCLIWLPHRSNAVEWAGMLSHEVIHATFFAGRCLGFQPSNKSEEFYAYFAQFLTERVYRKMLP